MKARVEFPDEEFAWIAELASGYFDVYGHDPESPFDKVLQDIYRKIKGEEWTK